MVEELVKLEVSWSFEELSNNKYISFTDSSQKLDCSYSVGQCVKASDLLTPKYIQFLISQATS